LTLPTFQIQRETYVSEKGATNDQHQREGGAALTKRDGQERPLFESLEDCQAAIGLLTRRDALEYFRTWEPQQAQRLREAFARLAGVSEKKKKAIPVAAATYEDRHVDIHEASQIIGFSETWLYRRVKQLPFARRSATGRWRFSTKGIQEWLPNFGRIDG